MSGGGALVEALKREHTDVIFGLPGGAIMPVYDELVDCGIRHVLVRHEQCAAHMADGYARASGRVGVCMATSGPGSTNLVTGIANAFLDSSPIVAVTGQVPKPFLGKDAFQEVDIIGITMPVTKQNYQVKSPSEVPQTVREAFWTAMEGRKGPVLIDMPKDVQTAEEDVSFPKELKRSQRGFQEAHPEFDVVEVTKMLTDAERLVILAGGGVNCSEASQELTKLAELLKAPVVTTLMAKGCISENHPLVMGMAGMHGMSYANYMVNEADVIFAVGCRFTDRTTGSGGFAKKARLIHVDIDPSEIGKNVEVDIAIVGDAKATIKLVLECLRKSHTPKDSSPWLKQMATLKRKYAYQNRDNGKSIKPPKLMKELRKILPPEAIVTTEVGQHQMWTAAYFKAYHPRTFISSGGLGTMGFGFPAALGAKVAKPDVPVVDIAGDGSFLMNQHELATSVKENIPVTIVIVDNRMLGMVAQWQRALFDRRYSQVELGDTPDFVKLAEAYGAFGLRAESYDEFRKAMKEALKSNVTTVIDVPISPEEDVTPIFLPGKTD